MKEIVFISGKGGTGKTSLVAAIASLASKQGKTVFSDCDVDAADLHLVFAPEIQTRTAFFSGHVAKINPKKCLSPGQPEVATKCIDLCRFGAISLSTVSGCAIDEDSCEGCGVCVHFCPANAVDFPERRCGEWYISDTRFGTLVHAALDTRAENSGKLVTMVRQNAKRIAEEQKANFILVDGSPGIGCPVIASITGADAVVIVTEPTQSGQHDLERVASMARHFAVPFYVCVNKADINPTLSQATQEWCSRNSIPFLGTIPWAREVTSAQIAGLNVIEYLDEKEDEHNIAGQIAGIWENICQLSQ